MFEVPDERLVMFPTPEPPEPTYSPHEIGKLNDTLEGYRPMAKAPSR